MIRKMRLLIIIGFGLFSILVGCEKIADVSLSQIQSDLNLVIDKTILKEGNGQDLRRFIGINPNEVDDFFYYISISSMDVEELLVIKMKDGEQGESFQSLIETHVENQINLFSGYKPENCGLLNNYELKVRGNYLYFAVSKDIDIITDAFLNEFEQ